MGRITKRYRVTKVRVPSAPAEGTLPLLRDGDDEVAVDVDTRADVVSVEEPLEIRVGGSPLTTTMRTPGNDIELVHGFLYSEGLITKKTDISTIRYCAGATGPDGRNTYNVVEVDFAPGVALPDAAARRAFTTTSACGVCGTTSIAQLMGKAHCAITPFTISVPTILSLPDALRAGQESFARTGGIHAAGLFTRSGEPLVIAEDVGRHNAADKVIGWALVNECLPLDDVVLALSSRASFELVQKAVMAGIGAMATVSAPSSLAIDTAREAGLILAGFVRPGRMNLYAGAERVLPGDLLR
ncbi:MAG: formate dehydrogenase accessory sulfurtransferase FdhD [Bowdeniella nasicola]|nr:formate dehydrogenase accessory sulfurtransferase FdhD [Bowdeniella nasicola]